MYAFAILCFLKTQFIQNVKEIQHCYLTNELFRKILIEQRKSHVFEKYPWVACIFQEVSNVTPYRKSDDVQYQTKTNCKKTQD